MSYELSEQDLLPLVERKFDLRIALAKAKQALADQKLKAKCVEAIAFRRQESGTVKEKETQALLDAREEHEMTNKLGLDMDTAEAEYQKAEDLYFIAAEHNRFLKANPVV